ncbi:MAG: NAD(P)-binding domain-containing protein [Deltaproteobacteria bacterium]|nr:NAD(P)-binding domain-containing protein [Deltaproteobacteria bacterium]
MAEHFDIVIIGAGPAGLGAAHNAAKNGVSHILIEKGEIGNTIYDYQLRKHVMAEPTKLPLRGGVEFDAGSREEILERWNKAVKEGNVNVRKGEVTKIQKAEAGFTIEASGASLTAKQVVLAIGVQGSPRKLGVPGDDLPHVAYTLADPDAFQGMDILVVGAGDAAIENALALCEKNKVSILNRSGEFPRAKEANASKILDAIKSGKVTCYYNSAVAKVEPEKVVITTPEGDVELKCNHIIARLGCILPRKFLESAGISFPSPDPNAVPVVDKRYECNVKGMYILGALIGYPLIKHAINQGFEVIEHILGREVEPADQVLVEEKLRVLPGEVNANLEMIRSKLPLFADLSDPQFRELIIDSTVHIKKPGDIIFERNDYTDSFWSIVSGTVAIDAGEKQIKINAGNFFGEMGLLSGRRRTATIRAAEECILLESPRKQILKLINSVVSVKKALDEVFMVRAMQTAIFPDADPAFLMELAKRCKMKNFKKGEVLFKQGDIGDVVYVIRKGSVKISRRNKAGADVAQTYIPAGNLVGEMAVLQQADQARSATVTAVVPTETILIEKQDFLGLLEQNPETKKRISLLASQRTVENITDETSEYTGRLLDFMMAEGVTDADNFLLIDSDLCIGCDNCEKACAATHSGYSRLDRKGGKTFASVQIPVSCRHCENPLCMLDCPPDALTRMPNGEVIIRDSCIGCGNCTRNCPYGVIQLVHDDEHGFNLLEWLGLKKKSSDGGGAAKAAKCDMCSHLNSGPACVRSCPTGAAIRANPRDMLRIVGGKQGVRA